MLGPLGPLDLALAAAMGCLGGQGSGGGGGGGGGSGGGGNSADYTRHLTEQDLGIQGVIKTIQGTISRVGQTLIVRVDLIEGRISNPFAIVEHLVSRARSEGANVLRIEMTVGNERLLRVLADRYGTLFHSTGSNDWIEIVVN